MNTLLWLQRDLRINDNPALAYALSLEQPIIVVFIDSPNEDGDWKYGAASNWWLHHSLEKLSAALAEHKIILNFYTDDSLEKIISLTTESEINTVVWTQRHEPHRNSYEQQIKTELNKYNIQTKVFKDELLQHPDDFLTATKSTPYKVFTPFYKKLRAEMNLHQTLKQSQPSDYKNVKSLKLNCSIPLEQLNLVDKHAWTEKLEKSCSVGEAAAYEKLERFIDEQLENYIDKRDFPAIDANSALSPHLHFGEISAQQIVNGLQAAINFTGGSAAQAAEAFLRQVIWREFARYILHHFPQTIDQAMNKKYNNSFWRDNQKHLKLWQQGKTGVELVDAGMAELWQTGIMHNRVRMLTASYLCKNLGIAWQHGAKWFWQTLVDADLANNSMGWQWVAGCGVDASPYYRIFNPVTQAEKFDKQASYRHRWLDLTKDRPAELVDLKESRVIALDRYQALIKNK